MSCRVAILGSAVAAAAAEVEAEAEAEVAPEKDAVSERP